MALKPKQRRLTNSEISAFCNQIALVLKAGISTFEGVSILSDNSSPELQNIFRQASSQLDIGNSLYHALKETGAFPAYVLHMIHLGEQTGKLEEVLESLSAYYMRESDIMDGIKHAVTYPFVMTCIMLIILFVLIGKVLPVFNHIYQELGSELTGFSRMLMNFSGSIGNYILALLALVFMGVIAVLLYFRSEKGLRFIKSRTVFMHLALSRFSNVMALVLNSGLDTDHGLSLSLNLVENPLLEEKIRICQKCVAEGDSFLSSLLTADLYDAEFKSLLTVGYKTGSMDIVMENLSVSYEQKTNDQIDHVISWLEPMLVILLSIIIGFILLAFLVPLLGIMSTLG